MSKKVKTLAPVGTPVAYKPFVRPAYAHSALPMLTEQDVPQTVLMRSLYRALKTRRAGDSMAEARFVAWLVNRVAATMIDAAGNVHVDTRLTPEHRTMFTSHTDTMHHQGGTNHIRLDKTDPTKTLWRADKGECLGADDGAGIALMLHMLDKGVPGYYIFFRGEESGGAGSSWLAQNMGSVMKDIDRCISFDRADYDEVITHQGGQRCCSDAFAKALADALIPEDLSLVFTPSNRGVFTDSANLTEHIAECTNLSVGYKHQHGDGEWQDVTFLQRMADQLVLVPWDTLPVARDPTADERYGFASGYTPDTFEELLVDALYNASYGKYEPLLVIVAEYAEPTDPASVRNKFRVQRVDSYTLEAYAAGVADGSFDSYQVLDICVSDMAYN